VFLLSKQHADELKETSQNASERGCTSSEEGIGFNEPQSGAISRGENKGTGGRRQENPRGFPVPCLPSPAPFLFSDLFLFSEPRPTAVH
jgi:hypothetical protein